MSSVAAHIYIRRHLLKAIFQLQCIYYLMLSSCLPLTKYHPYYRGRKNNWIFMCSTTLFQGPLHYTSHSIFMAYYRSIPLEVSMAKPFLGSAVQEMKPHMSNLNCHLTFPPPPPNHIQNWGDLQTEIQTGTSVIQDSQKCPTGLHCDGWELTVVPLVSLSQTG